MEKVIIDTCLGYFFSNFANGGMWISASTVRASTFPENLL